VQNQAEVVLLSISAAFAFAMSSSLKHVSAGQVPDAQNLHLGSVGRLIRGTLAHPLWLGAIVADAVGLALQIIALHLGALAVVQPLLISGLLFALLLRRGTGHHLSHSQLGWAVLLTAALACFVLLARPTGQHTDGVDRAPAVAAALMGVLFAVVCVMLGRRQRSEGRSAALIGTAVGALYAVTAALLKAVTDIAVHGPVALLTSWQLYAVIVLGALGLLLNQIAFQAGPLTASLPAIATVDPLLSIAAGVWLYDEHSRSGPAAGIGLVVLLLVLGISVIQLSRTAAEEL
jgi:drug/metabolite transporter (DMT)-like permease